MTTLDDIIFHFQTTVELAKNGTISTEELIDRVEQGTEKLKETYSILDLAVRSAYAHIQRLCKNNLTTETPPEVKEIRK